MVLGCFGQKLCFARGGRHVAMMWAILLVITFVCGSDAEPSNSIFPSEQESDFNRWMATDGQESLGSAENSPVKEAQGENEYWDYLFREGMSAQVEPKKKPTQLRYLGNLKPRRKQLISRDERMATKRDINGVSMSITHNLDILRQGLLRELNMRQREQDRKQVMENNKKFLNGLGR